MMKKVALVCMLLFVVAASASAVDAPYTWNLNGCDQYGTNGGAQVRLGVATAAASTDQNWDLSVTGCYTSVVTYTGALDSTMVKTGLLMTDKVLSPDPKKWILQVNGNSSWVTAPMDVRIFASSSSAKPAGSWKLFKLYDPITNVWGRTDLGAVPIGATTGTMASPWFKLATADLLPSYKTSTPLAYGNGYILELSVPEPGSMVAMLSGLVGLVGFGIRRRR